MNHLGRSVDIAAHVAHVLHASSALDLGSRLVIPFYLHSTLTAADSPERLAAVLLEHLFSTTTSVMDDSIADRLPSTQLDSLLHFGPVCPLDLGKRCDQTVCLYSYSSSSSHSSPDSLSASPSATPPAAHNHDKDAIAIVGYAGRFPSASDADELWALLCSGTDTHRRIPPDRFDVDAHYDPSGRLPNSMLTQYGCFVDNPGFFDSRFFAVSPREAKQMDPVQRLALITAYEALDLAGLVPGRTPATLNHRVGTFYGQAGDDWREVNTAQYIDTYFIPGGIRAFTPGRINYHFKFAGPSYSVDTACSSSFAAIQLACLSLLARACDTAVAGGVNVLTNPDVFAGLSRGHFLSTTGQCKPLDAAADGYCRADGVGSVVLKRLADAHADHDIVYGVVLGTDTNHSAEAASITRPHHAAQAALCRSIIDRAGVHPHDIDYVEMHGTGTQAGDYHEMLSVSDVFAPPSSSLARRPRPLYVGSVKANVGHGEAAAGVMSLIKVLKMLEHHSIPPHIGVRTTVNPAFAGQLAERNICIPDGPVSWPSRPGRPRHVFLNNFSAAGGNTAMLLRDEPVGRRLAGANAADPRSTLVVQVSAKTPESLAANLVRLADHLHRHGGAADNEGDNNRVDDAAPLRLSDLSYTTMARKCHFPYRLAVAVSTRDELLAALRAAAAAERGGPRLEPVSPKRAAFVFTGQGKAYDGLAKSLFQTSSLFCDRILCFSRIAVDYGFPPLVGLVDGSVATKDASPVLLQLAAVCVQMALTDLLASWDVRPAAVVGHSLGEYAAFYAAGCLKPSEVIEAVGRRASLMVDLCEPHAFAMLAVAAPQSELPPLPDGVCVACLNSPRETVLAGPRPALERLQATLGGDKKKPGGRLLSVPYAFHSAQMDVILEPLARSKMPPLRDPRVPFVSALLGRVARPADLLATDDDTGSRSYYYARHAREPVRFLPAVLDAHAAGLLDSTVWVELGNHPTCGRFLDAALGTPALPLLRAGQDAWRTLAGTLASLFNQGISVDWNEYHREYESVNRLLRLPAYAFDLKK